MDLGRVLLPLRLFLGVTFCYAGLQKLYAPGFLDGTSAGSAAPQLRRRPLLYALPAAATAAGLGLLTAAGVGRLGRSGRRSAARAGRPTPPVGGAVLVNDASNRPVYVVQPEAGQFVAFSAACTHAGCPVNFDAKAREFACPCHGARYDIRTGAVLSKPAPRPLDRVPVPG